MKKVYIFLLSTGLAMGLTACGKPHAPHADTGHHGHDHGDGSHHEHGEKASDTATSIQKDPAAQPKDHGHDHSDDGHDAGHHGHEETDLGKATIGDMEVTLAQGHGKLVAGQEGHLVIKLPYNDKGATIVRAWIGTEDRTLSYVGKAEYAVSRDDYDVHAMAPAELNEHTRWWIEIEKPDGTRAVGSAKALRE